MKIGIDISQIVYENTGVANFVKQFVISLLAKDTQNEYILFFASKETLPSNFITTLKKVARCSFRVKKLSWSPRILEILWNKLHIFPLEWFVGDVDIFITSDWVEPPARKAKKITILYDLIVYTHPKETGRKIVANQKQKLRWVVKETAKLLCISESTMQDAESFLAIGKERLAVIYPGVEI